MRIIFTLQNKKSKCKRTSQSSHQVECKKKNKKPHKPHTNRLSLATPNDYDIGDRHFCAAGLSRSTNKKKVW